MMPLPTSEHCRRPGSRNSASNGGSGSGGAAPVWDGSIGRGSPRADLTTSATPTRNLHTSTTVTPAVGAAAAGGSGGGSQQQQQQTRSPFVTTHQPYRGVPLSMFGVESELEGYAGTSTENLVTVKAAYKTGITRTSGPIAAGGCMPATHRTAQRSPIAALDGSDAQVGQIGDLCGVVGPAPTSSAAVAMRNAPYRVGLKNNNSSSSSGGGNRRTVSLDVAERYCGDGGLTGQDKYRCPVALRMVETEEKHLNYTGVELHPSEINLGETTERLRRLQQRRRQVQYGKETVGYINYTRAVPSRCDREFRNPMHPMTPRPEYDCSKRTFDRYLNIWRRQLHLWDAYDPNNPEPHYARIGIPTLRTLALELPPSTPDCQQNSLISLTQMPPTSGVSACTPVMFCNSRRDQSISVGSHQRSTGYQQNGGGVVGVVGGAAQPPNGAMHARPLSGSGGPSWSITNTPHTPYHGSTHSTSSYQPPLLSVLAQPTIYSPHWADSSRQSSPNPHASQRSNGYLTYPTSAVGGPAPQTTTTTAAGAGAGAAATMTTGNSAFWEGGSMYHGGGGGGNNNNNNTAGYLYRSYGSPYGGHRYTPQSTPNHYYYNHHHHHHHHHHHYAGNNNNNNMAANGAPCGGANGNMMGPPPLCVGQESWGNPPRQMHQ